MPVSTGHGSPTFASSRPRGSLQMRFPTSLSPGADVHRSVSFGSRARGSLPSWAGPPGRVLTGEDPSRSMARDVGLKYSTFAGTASGAGPRAGGAPGVGPSSRKP